MANDQNHGERDESRAVLSDQSRAWWTSVLAGQIDAPHPVHGANLKARIEDDTLVVSGAVPSEEDLQAVTAETEHLKGHGITGVRNELEVVPVVTDQGGLLSQTLVGIFENGQSAGFAEGYLREHAHVREQLMKLITSGEQADGRAALQAVLPEAFWEDATKALDDGQALLIVTVDETEAFKTRELLDEETRSLRTLILPPEAASNTTLAQRALAQVEQASTSQEPEPQFNVARERALRQGRLGHES